MSVNDSECLSIEKHSAYAKCSVLLIEIMRNDTNKLAMQ